MARNTHCTFTLQTKRRNDPVPISKYHAYGPVETHTGWGTQTIVYFAIGMVIRVGTKDFWGPYIRESSPREGLATF
jgi:hypothetical protein